MINNVYRSSSPRGPTRDHFSRAHGRAGTPSIMHPVRTGAQHTASHAVAGVRSRPSRLGASDVPPLPAFPSLGHAAVRGRMAMEHGHCCACRCGRMAVEHPRFAMAMALACRWHLRPSYLAAPQAEGAPGPPPIRAGTEYVRTSDSSPLQCTCQIREGEGPRAH